MYARVARWEGADADAICGPVPTEINARRRDRSAPGGAGEGLSPAHRPRGRAGRSRSAFFESEEDRATGHATLEFDEPSGRRHGPTAPAVEMYEVGRRRSGPSAR